VLILWGDGSCGYSIAEFDTFARFGIPVVALVGNDACWAQIEREQTPMFKSQVACNLAYAPYEQVAEGYGGMGISLNYGDDVSAVLREAFEVSRQQRRPVLVNAGIGKSDFREGSLSV
jgi:acetolactate synthase-like protein